MTDVSLEFLSVEEYCAITRLSLSTVRRRIRDGSLPVHQPGGRRTAIRIPRSALTINTNHQPLARETHRRPAPRWMRAD